MVEVSTTDGLAAVIEGFGTRKIPSEVAAYAIVIVCDIGLRH